MEAYWWSGSIALRILDLGTLKREVNKGRKKDSAVPDGMKDREDK
jgi:hypothetical protein